MTERAGEDDALLTLAFSLSSNPGAYALLIGAGVSKGAGLPTAWDVLVDLTDRVATLQGADIEDSVAWYERTFNESAAYESLLERLAPTPFERQSLLRRYFEPSDEESDIRPSEAHRAIAKLVRVGTIRLIITLNFDRLLERAIRDEGIEPTVVATPGDIAGLAPLHTLSCCIIHLHGDYLNPTSMLNTATELASYRATTRKLLEHALTEYGLIIAGWSSKYDPALREAISAHYPSRYTLAWLEPGQPTDEATHLRVLKRGLLIATNADAGFGRLADAVQSLSSRNSRHPLTVAVAVETAKRELSGHSVSISLHDTLGREFRRLHDLADFHLADYQSDEPYGGYSLMVERIDEASKVVCALVTTLVYWGSPALDRWWLGELPRFAVQSEGGGQTRLLTLRLVAGASIFYAAGVAAVAAERFDLLRTLFSGRREHPYGGVTQSFASLFTPTSLGGPGQARPFAVVYPLLREALTWPDERLEETCQLFEILRFTFVLMGTPAYGNALSSYLALSALKNTAEDDLESAKRTGGDLGETADALASRENEAQKSFDEIVRLVPAEPTHVLTAQSNAGWSHTTPVADQLLSDVLAERDQHLLLTSGFARSVPALVVALRATSAALGALGKEAAWRDVPPAGGTLRTPLWLDTELTPSEQRQAADG